MFTYSQNLVKVECTFVHIRELFAQQSAAGVIFRASDPQTVSDKTRKGSLEKQESPLRKKSIKQRRDNSNNFNSPKASNVRILLNDQEKDQGSTSVPVQSKLQQNQNNIDLYDTHTENVHLPTFGGDHEGSMKAIRQRRLTVDEDLGIPERKQSIDNPFEIAHEF